ncbi:MAG: acyl-CoA thioesterase [Polyangiaceae bacterium]|nr:acyl-CoA thioesterase [Polyangiaceae bacterium]
MVPFLRAVKFEEVDAAGIVFFACFSSYAHEAMEHFFGALPGGYPDLIMRRRIGLPAVELTARFLAPLRYGDALRIETTTAELGRRSARLHYRMLRQSDGVLAAEIFHKVVTTKLEAVRSCDMPEDVRAIFTAHLASPAAAPRGG